MYRSKLLRLATTAFLSAFSLVGAAQATTYDLAADWATAMPTTTAAAAATSASFGVGGAWTVGSLSSNWANMNGTTTNTNSFQSALDYWTPMTGTGGNITSGGSAGGNVVESTTGAYTVPFQFYAATPGSTETRDVGKTFTGQVAEAQSPYNVQSGTTKITLPSGSVSGGATSGTMTYEPKMSTAANNASTEGFSNNADLSTSANDGTGTVRDVIGAFYNYATSTVSPSSDVMPSSAATDTITQFGAFGPSAVEWTAPANGFATINTTAYNTVGPNSGFGGFYVLEQAAGVTTAPTELVSVLNQIVTGGVLSSNPSGQWYTSASGMSAYGAPNGVNTIPADTASISLAPDAYWSGGTALEYEYQALHYVSTTLTVTAGESIYFVDDAGQNQLGTNGNHAWTGDSAPEQLQALVAFQTVPEPSSLVLLGIAGVGLALTAWKRRRLAA